MKLPELWGNFYFVNLLQPEFFSLIPFRIGFTALLFELLKFRAIDIFCLCHGNGFLNLIENSQSFNFPPGVAVVISTICDDVPFSFQSLAHSLPKIPNRRIYSGRVLRPKL